MEQSTQSEPERKQYLCDFCEKQLKQEDAYKNSKIFDQWGCEICSKTFSPSQFGWHCSCTEEGFDICNDCFEKGDCRIKIEFKCDYCRSELHKEKAYKDSQVFNSWICDICKETHKASIDSWNCPCKPEGFDVCDFCYKRKDGRGMFLDEYKRKFQAIQALNPQEKADELEKVKRTAKHRQKDIKEQQIIDKAQQQERLTVSFGKIMPNCLSESIDLKQSDVSTDVQQETAQKDNNNQQKQQNLGEKVVTDGIARKNFANKDNEKMIKNNFMNTRQDLEKMDNSRLLEIILKLQLQLGRTMEERNDLQDEVDRLKEIYEVQQVVDYPFQSKIQPDHYGLYTGEMVNGKRHGKGLTVWDDGVEQLGQFQNDYLNGYGEIHSGPNDYYKGEFRNGEFDGHGAIQYPNGNVYLGDFQYHKKHGMGKLYEKTQDGKEVVYEGCWRNGAKHGIFTVIDDHGVKKKNCIFRNNALFIDGKVAEN